MPGDLPIERAAELDAYHQLRGSRLAMPGEPLRLSSLDELTEQLAERLAGQPLHSLWVQRLMDKPTGLYDTNEVLELSKLKPFKGLKRLRLDVPALNLGGVRLDSVRQLHLSGRIPGQVRRLDVNYRHAFPALEKLTCSFERLRAVLECKSCDHCTHSLSELRVLSMGKSFSPGRVELLCDMLPALRGLWRLRLEMDSFKRLHWLDAFREMPARWGRWLKAQQREAGGQLARLEFTSPDLLLPGRAELPDLHEAIEYLQEALLLDEMVVTLWGFHLQNGAGQTEQLYAHLRSLQSQPAAEEKIFDW